MLLPCKFNGSAMRGILFFDFAGCDPLNGEFQPWLSPKYPISYTL